MPQASYMLDLIKQTAMPFVEKQSRYSGLQTSPFTVARVFLTAWLGQAITKFIFPQLPSAGKPTFRQAYASISHFKPNR